MQSNTFNQLIQTSQTKLSMLLNLTASESKFEVQILLLHVLNKDRAWLIAHENDAVQSNINEAFQALLNRRLNGEPIAYILGYREFYGLHLKVSPDTLIPRPDTETLVEAALAKISQNVISSPSSFPRRRENEHKETKIKSSFEERPSMLNLSPKMDSRLRGNDEQTSDIAESNAYKILDLGTGTGAIALAIAKNRPLANVVAVDVNQATLNVAIENAKSLNISNVQFILSDWLSALNNQKFDLIVSNPPYIEADDAHLQQGDLRFEPLSALASGSDGLVDIRKIIDSAPQYLNTDGWLMLEHGYNQAESVATLLKQAGFKNINHVLDLSGIKRVTIGQI